MTNQVNDIKNTIRIFNTLSGKQEELISIDKDHLKMYVCGPTVYDRPHLGNARSTVVYDLFFRLFSHIFPRVTYVRNITDVDDKINNSAKEHGISIRELTAKITDFFYNDIDALNVLRPTFEPKVTDNIPEIINIIEKLLANKNAYISSNHVIFDVSSYKNYGKLSNRKLDEMISGSRIEIADYKKDPLDFVLWKPSDDNDDASSIFDSPWGKGRPGWHIECSAMSSKYLGDNFDVHGGGADLQFPHHENEIAQSCSANRGSIFAKYWIHNGFLTVNGEKMSKSLKNFITVRDLLDKNISGVVIRLMLLSTHYRKPFDLNEKALEDSKKNIQKFFSIIEKSDFEKILEKQFFSPSKAILEFLSDDLNISKVIAFLHDKVKEIKSNHNEELRWQFVSDLDFLGLLDKKMIEENLEYASPENPINEKFILEQIAMRQKFKNEKNYLMADEIRKNLLKIGVVLEDKTDGNTLWRLL